MVPQKTLIKISAKTSGRCFYCNRMGEEVDHFVSKKQWVDWDIEPYMGSCDEVRNLFLSCVRCNRRKSDETPEDFIGNSYIAWSRFERANRRIGILV